MNASCDMALYYQILGPVQWYARAECSLEVIMTRSNRGPWDRCSALDWEMMEFVDVSVIAPLSARTFDRELLSHARLFFEVRILATGEIRQAGATVYGDKPPQLTLLPGRLPASLGDQWVFSLRTH